MVKPINNPYSNPPTASSRNNVPISAPISVALCSPAAVAINKIPENTTTPIPSLNNDSPSIFTPKLSAIFAFFKIVFLRDFFS